MQITTQRVRPPSPAYGSYENGGKKELKKAREYPREFRWRVAFLLSVLKDEENTVNSSAGVSAGFNAFLIGSPG